MSEGTPTWLVKDGTTEGRDDPRPDEPFARTPVRIEPIDPHPGSDLLRADDAEREEISDFERQRRPFEVYDQTIPGAGGFFSGWITRFTRPRPQRRRRDN